MTQLSVILPVRNEANLILSAISRLRKCGSLFHMEIIVVDSGSLDHTVQMAEQAADLVVHSPKSSRSYQMNLGAQNAKGDLLLFLHVDTKLPEDWQSIVNRSFLQSSAPPVAAAFRLGFDSDELSFKLLAALANWRTLFTRVPHGDQALIVWKEDYIRCGGFPYVPLMEEYIFIPRLRRFGRIDIYPESVVTSARKYRVKGPLRNGLKNSLIIFLYYMGVSPNKLAKLY